MNDVNNQEVILLKTIMALAIILDVQPELLARTTLDHESLDKYMGKMNSILLDVVSKQIEEIKNDTKD